MSVRLNLNELQKAAGAEEYAAEADIENLLEEGEDAQELPEESESAADALTENSVRLYLKEIGKIPMLSEERVIELSKIIAAAKPYLRDDDKAEGQNAEPNDEATDEDAEPAPDKYAALREELGFEPGPEPNLRDDPKTNLCTPEPEKTPEEIQAIIEAAQKAKDELVQGNLRLVVANAKKLVGQALPLQDLIQEGSIGLMKAAERFDWTQGYQFSTYATWWVRQAMLRAIANLSSTIRRPVHMRDKLNRIGKFRQAFYQKNGCEPSVKEIASGLGYTDEEVLRALADVSVVTSLDAPVGGEDSDSNLGDIIADNESESPVDAVNNDIRREVIMQALGTLDPREADVLKLRYGLADGNIHTLEEIGDLFDITRERIRQIEKKALKKLRATPHVAKSLQTFYYQ